MKKLIIIAVVLFSAKISSGRDVMPSLMWSAFSTPENKSYIETYLSVVGNSVNYVKNKNGKYQASVDIAMAFISSDDSIHSPRHYVLNSPEIDDTTNEVNFLDLQRIPLSVGAYNLQIIFTDLNRNPLHAVEVKTPILVDLDPDSVCTSHIEFLESYSASTKQTALTKSGYDLVPYVSSFIPDNMQKLNFYAEIYNTQKVFPADSKFLVLYYIEAASTGNKLQDFNAFAKPTTQKVVPLLYSFNIQTLPSGNYNLVIEVRNSLNRLMSMRKTPFERFNPGVTFKLDDLNTMDVANTFVGKINNKDTLIDMIRCLRPISSSSQVDFAETRIKAGDVKLMQQYIYNFWLGVNEKNPEGAWLAYKQQVDAVNQEFGSIGIKGYETDRGRVYLQYGPPDARVPSTQEPSSYPYEIWQYYTIRPNPNMGAMNKSNLTTQTNKKFVFADFDLVTNNYKLIHSDAQGEVRDDNWQLRLVKRDNSTHDLDQQTGNPQYGGHANDWYTDPH